MPHNSKSKALRKYTPVSGLEILVNKIQRRRMEVSQGQERMKLRQGRHPSILGDVWLVSEISVDRVTTILGK